MQEIASLRRAVNNMAEGRKMAGCHLFLLVVMMTHLLPFPVDGGITLSKTCGEVACQQHEFCSQYDRLCTKCETVCEKESHNYQEDICLKDCQDYLHDMRYLRKGGETTSEDVEDLRNSVERLTQLSTASLCVSVILLLLLCALAFLLWIRSKRSAQPTAISREDANKNPFKMDTTPVAVISNPSNGLKLDIPQQQSNSRQTPQPQAPPPPSVASESFNSPATTTTPLSIRPPRFPSEDTTLDYAYDNRALTPSPRPEGSRPTPIKGETSF